MQQCDYMDPLQNHQTSLLLALSATPESFRTIVVAITKTAVFHVASGVKLHTLGCCGRRSIVDMAAILLNPASCLIYLVVVSYRSSQRCARLFPSRPNRTEPTVPPASGYASASMITAVAARCMNDLQSQHLRPDWTNAECLLLSHLWSVS